ncbi:DNA-binding transcriptional regulator [Brevundimonas sp. LM2]|uniref:helix-turn-helix domain-containing protein n=1 Tax=Brevundimonas sp. LM2 TaxID=1938605 RepID=UPI0015C5412F|nr:helix-turn-helix domain-containing protein [Brevundimonas sp. LM2]
MAIVRRTLDLNNLKGLSAETERRLDAMTEAEIEANALSDPDNPPLTDDELRRGWHGREIRLAREATGLSQAAFAERYGLTLGRLRDLEQGRSYDGAVTAYCMAIGRDPDGVAQAVAHLVDRDRAA